MEPISGRDIAIHITAMSGNFLRWHKVYIERSCNIRATLARHRLTMQQFQILRFLYGNPETNTVSAMSSELLISKGSLSLMLSRLEKAGYLRKDAPQKEDDGRKIYLSLTEAACKIVEEAQEVLLGSISSFFDQMDAEARIAFYTKLMELQKIFAAGGIKL